jgi:hypothetical protein
MKSELLFWSSGTVRKNVLGGVMPKEEGRRKTPPSELVGQSVGID